MRRFPITPKKRSRIEIIPMIDVMMFLLVFFVLISINVIPALGLKLNLPASGEGATSAKTTRVMVSIPASGPVFLNDQSTQNLDHLRELLKQASKGADPKTIQVVITSDQQTELQRLVDVMDTVRSAGLDAMTLSTRRRGS